MASAKRPIFHQSAANLAMLVICNSIELNAEC